MSVTGREFWRIREFLAGKSMNMADIGRRVGVSRNLVRETARGHRNNRKVLFELVALGCPEKFLALPDDMKPARAA